MAAQAFIRMSRTARPMVELARLPGPKRLLRALMPSSCTTGPLTITSTAAPPMLDDGPTRLKGGASMASVAASTTGMYSGLQPAITALAATFSAVISRRRSGSSPTISAPSLPPAARNSATLSVVGGNMGSPSVQPKSYRASTALNTSVQLAVVVNLVSSFNNSMLHGQSAGASTPARSRFLAAPRACCGHWRLQVLRQTRFAP